MNKTFALKIGKSLIHDNLRVNGAMVERFQYDAWIPYMRLSTMLRCIKLEIFEFIGVSDTDLNKHTTKTYAFYD